jgi:2-hydroxycyclohexanecarboxyl-CoA dehydrogenase
VEDVSNLTAATLEESFSLRGKRILATGSASGIGKAFALLAAESGASLAMLDVNGDGLAETAAQATNAGQALTYTVDLTDWEQVEAAVAAAVSALDGLDAVCNIAGWDSPGRFWEQPLDLWTKLLDVNLRSQLHVCRATVPVLIEAGAGRIVNVASDAGRVGSKGETVYAAAKGGVIALTKSLARELAPSGVSVNCVCPGPTRTPLFEQEEKDNPKLMEKLARAVPMRRIAEPEDIARAIAFFASEAASYITGQVLSVSGGLTMVG